MPQIGEHKKGREIGHSNTTGNFIWQACAGCGKERWVLLRWGEPRNTLCLSCKQKGHQVTLETRRKLSFAHRGQKSFRWKGGRLKTIQGYIMVRLSPEDFFYPMINNSGCVFEHRLVMAKHLGRNLHSWELVHHKRGIAKDDNRIEGLQLCGSDKHNALTILETQIKQLKAENKRLREQCAKSY